MISGNQTDDRDRQACRKDRKAGSQRHIGRCSTAKQTDLGESDERDQQAVDTLGTRKQLQNQNLCELVGILTDNTRCCLTCKAYAPGASHTGQNR